MRYTPWNKQCADFSPVPETGKNSYLDTQQISVQVNSAALRVFPPGVLKIDGKKDFI